jgi:predicted Ser/Thr protein kinase
VVAPNEMLGFYRLIESIGAGGMGEVWKAEDTRLGRTVAVKILPAAVAGDHDAVARMRREARVAAQLNHPNIATIHSFEEIGERLFIVMEYVDGEPLTKLIQRGALDEADLCRIGRGVAEALAEAHAKGVVHRDIKPDNIMVSGTRVKVLDFGIAKQIEVMPGASDPTAPLLTQQGMILGTVQFMSPEQALGKTLDTRTDIFSLGVVLYQAATGVLPFAGESVTETITKIVRDDPPPLRTVSPGMAAIVNRCLRKSRDDRFPNAGDLASALDAQLVRATTAPMTRSHPAAAPTVVGSVTQTKPPRWTWGALVAVIAGVAVALIVALRPEKTALVAVATKPAPTATVTPISPQPTATVADVPAAASDVPAARPGPPKTAIAAPAPDTGPTADELFATGVNALEERRIVEARRAFSRALRKEPGHLKSQLALALLADDRRRAAALAQELRKQRRSDPDLERLRRLVENRRRQR